MTIEDIALQMTRGIGVKGAVHLLEIFGNARNIFGASLDELIHQAQLKPDIARNILQKQAFHAAEREIEYCRRNGISVIASTDPEYPALLREIPDYPIVIYAMGNLGILSGRCLSMVGTRQASPYGQIMCNRLVSQLAEQVPDS